VILEGTFDENGVIYDRRLEPSDWRYSAAAVGMVRFFKRRKIQYFSKGRYLYYNFKDIYPEDAKTEISNDREYLLFAEHWFSDGMPHKAVKQKVSQSQFSENEIKELSKKLTANKVMKKIFQGIKLGKDAGEKQIELLKKISNLIEANRLELIQETFLNSKIGYGKFNNPSRFRCAKDEICRLWGYYVDTRRKTKSLGFCFDKKAKVARDEVEFDFIPFAFSRGRISIFINNNTSIKYLIQANDEMENFLQKRLGERTSWNTIFYVNEVGSWFIDYDVEVIKKDAEKEWYETIFIRKSAIQVFQDLDEAWKAENRSNLLDMVLGRSIKIGDNYYIKIMDEVTESILNERPLDNLIERLLKLEYKIDEEVPDTFLLRNLICINLIVYKNFLQVEGKMGNNAKLEGSHYAAKDVVKYFKINKQENKIKIYRQRLANTLVTKDYDRFIEIMLQLSSYTELPFPFLHLLIKDFEENKNQAYNFVNSLIEENKERKSK